MIYIVLNSFHIWKLFEACLYVDSEDIFMNDGHFTTSLNNGLLIFHKDHDHTFLTKTTGDSINSKKIIYFYLCHTHILK